MDTDRQHTENIYEVRIHIFHEILKVGRGLQKAKMWAWGGKQGLGWCGGVKERPGQI